MNNNIRNSQGGSIAVDVSESLEALLAYCRRENWAGWDPYDGLTSPLFANVPPLKNYFCRLAFIQAMKRSPVNLRPLFIVPKERNPKGIALFAASLVRLEEAGLCARAEATDLLDDLIKFRSSGYQHMCWGYNFDWQTRGGFVPRFTPNIICTTFAGNALLDGYERFGTSAYLDHAVSAAEYIVEGLYREDDKDETCLSYTPHGASQIHNASLLGAAFFARVYSHTGVDRLKDIAMKAVRYSLRRQRPDGSWLYGEDPTDGWVDSFHTGYNLMALETVRQRLAEETIKPSIVKGYDYFLDRFFTSHGSVKYFHNRELPVDMHAVATAIITLAELAHYRDASLPLAERVLKWADATMRSSEGWYYYQKRRFHTVRIPYMRWTQSWMLRAQTSLFLALAKPRTIEAASVPSLTTAST